MSYKDSIPERCPICGDGCTEWRTEEGHFISCVSGCGVLWEDGELLVENYEDLRVHDSYPD